jgi:hypothetical protein
MNGSSDEAKVNIVAMFLIGTMKLWWREPSVGFGCLGTTMEKIENWVEMNATLKA